jgi:hypothetical protein
MAGFLSGRCTPSCGQCCCSSWSRQASSCLGTWGSQSATLFSTFSNAVTACGCPASTSLAADTAPALLLYLVLSSSTVMVATSPWRNNTSLSLCARVGSLCAVRSLHAGLAGLVRTTGGRHAPLAGSGRWQQSHRMCSSGCGVVSSWSAHVCCRSAAKACTRCCWAEFHMASESLLPSCRCSVGSSAWYVISGVGSV